MHSCSDRDSFRGTELVTCTKGRLTMDEISVNLFSIISLYRASALLCVDHAERFLASEGLRCVKKGHLYERNIKHG